MKIAIIISLLWLPLLVQAAPKKNVSTMAKVTSLYFGEDIRVGYFYRATTFFDGRHSVFAWDQELNWMPDHNHRCDITFADGSAVEQHYDEVFRRRVSLGGVVIAPGVYKLQLSSEMKVSDSESMTKTSRFLFDRNNEVATNDYWDHVKARLVARFNVQVLLTHKDPNVLTKKGKRSFKKRLNWTCYRLFTTRDVAEWQETPFYSLEDFIKTVGTHVRPIGFLD